MSGSLANTAVYVTDTSKQVCIIYRYIIYIGMYIWILMYIYINAYNINILTLLYMLLIHPNKYVLFRYVYIDVYK